MRSSRKQGRVVVRQLDETTRTGTTTTPKTGSYTGEFESHLIDHNILPHDYWYPNGDEPPRPDNLNAIQAMLGRRRESLSASGFTEHHFKKFRRLVATSNTETAVLVDVLQYIQGEMGVSEGIMRDVAFRNFEPLTDGALVAAKPDICFGTPRQRLRAEIRDELDTLVVPSQEHNRPVLPNNFLEAESPFGAAKVARLQAMYDAALGCRAFHSLQNYGETETTYDNNAYTLAWTYIDGVLAAYTCHPLPPSNPEKRPGYVMTHLKSWFLTSDIGDFRQAAAAFRNGRDWTRLQRENIIARANNVSCKFASGCYSPSTTPTTLTVQECFADSDTKKTAGGYVASPVASCTTGTSLDELSPEYELRYRPVQLNEEQDYDCVARGKGTSDATAGYTNTRSVASSTAETRGHKD